MAAEARALGLSGEAEKLDAQLQAQRSALAGRLRLAADHGAPGALEAAMEEARTWGMEEGVLAEARGALEARQVGSGGDQQGEVGVPLLCWVLLWTGNA